MKRSRPIGVLSVFLLSVVFTPQAFPIDSAVSFVSAGAGLMGDYNYSESGPMNSGGILYKEYYYSNPNFQESAYANATIKTTFDGVQSGKTTTLGEISGNGYASRTEGGQGTLAFSSTYSYLYFSYMPAQIRIPPFNADIPVTLSAKGNVDIASSSMASGQASVQAYTTAPGFDVAQSNYTASKASDGGAAFDYKTLLWLTPGVSQTLYMYGNGLVQTLGGSAAYSFFVDPTFGLDQAAFDALYGENSFPLNEYYALQFSPNMTVTPIPSTVLLFGSGLAGLVGLGRWRLRK